MHITPAPLSATGERAVLPLHTIEDVLLARVVARAAAVRLGFPPVAVSQITTAVAEATRNVVQHANAPGHLHLSCCEQPGQLALELRITDTGTGLADSSAAISDESPGAGLPSCRRLMDDFKLESASPGGTTLTMRKWLPNACAD